LSILLLIEVCFLLGFYVYASNLYVQIFSVFSGMSLSLFGGGFVIIPYMQGLLVDKLHWINTREFIDAIALGQVTPGPILVSCTFIGYKMGGILGGILATVAIFFPSSLLVVCLAKTIRHTNSYLKGTLKGIQPVVIGMIIASGIQLLETIKAYSMYTILFGVVAFCLLYFYKTSPLYIIPISIFLSVVSYLMLKP
jgi:chromate transporter